MAGISPTKISKILITHWHGDHIWGLPGLLQSIASTNKKQEIEIYGPKRTLEFLKNMKKAFSPSQNMKFNAKEIIKESKIIDTKHFEIRAKPVSHSTHCLAYSFKEKDKRRINLEYTKKFGLTKDPLLGKLQQGKTIIYKKKKITPEKGTILIPGKKITFITDVKNSKDLIKFAQNSDLLILESTLSDDLKKEAAKTMHLTAKQAAEIAKAAKAKKLILTHFSQRYRSTRELEEQAKSIFKNTEAAKDFMSITI
ncbi:MAG: MBL fold metallo-hydrolase [Candidatus Woesearchaeota archaeon]